MPVKYPVDSFSLTTTAIGFNQRELTRSSGSGVPTDDIA